MHNVKQIVLSLLLHKEITPDHPGPALPPKTYLTNEKQFPMINSKTPETVTTTPEDHAEARRLEDDPALILALVDLIFMDQEAGRAPVS